MSEMKYMILQVTERMLKEHVDSTVIEALENGQWAQSLWQLFKENGIPAVAIAEEHGGAGGDVEDLLHIIRLTGKYAAPIPFLETTLANYLLETLSLQTITTTACSMLDHSQAFQLVDGVLTGEAMHIPWARHVHSLVTLARSATGLHLVVVDLTQAMIVTNTNLAGEPRDTVHFTNATIVQQSPALHMEQLQRMATFETACYLAFMTGAMEKITTLTVQYTKEREQFGRPIHRFQLVQQHLVHLVGETTIAVTNFDNIIADLQPQTVAYARLRMEDAIQTVTTIAHQVHAAIGTTAEYPLHFYTRRLWAWRDEGVPATDWANEIAQALIEQDDLWGYLTTNTKKVE